MDDLTQMVIDYQQGRGDEAEVTARVAVGIFQYLEAQFGKTKEENSDLLTAFYPRIPRMIKNFHYTGTPFLHYLKRSIKLQRRSLIEQKIINRNREYVMESDAMYTAEESTSWEVDESSGWPPLVPCEVLKEAEGEIFKRKLILMTLRSVPFLTDAQVEHIARVGELDLAWLQACIYRVKLQLAPKLTRLEVLTQRRRFIHSRRLQTESELAHAYGEPQRVELRQRLQRLQMTQDKLNQTISSLKIVPTHLDLAKMLQIPKGTVDSCLYYLKTSLVQGYSGGHDDSFSHQQPAQEARTRRAHEKTLPRPEAPPPRRRRVGRLGS